MLPIFSTLRIVDLDDMIAEINGIRATIFIITSIKIAISHGEKSVMFVVKKVVALVNIQMIRNGRQKNFGDKTKNSMEIKANTSLF